MKIEQLKKQLSLWESITQEPIELTLIKSGLYGFCSELAALRLFKAYNSYMRNNNTKCAYSENRKTWFFVWKS